MHSSVKRIRCEKKTQKYERNGNDREKFHQGEITRIVLSPLGDDDNVADVELCCAETSFPIYDSHLIMD